MLVTTRAFSYALYIFPSKQPKSLSIFVVQLLLVTGVSTLPSHH